VVIKINKNNKLQNICGNKNNQTHAIKGFLLFIFSRFSKSLSLFAWVLVLTKN
jgi:hypothetical protein